MSKEISKGEFYHVKIGLDQGSCIVEELWVGSGAAFFFRKSDTVPGFSRSWDPDIVFSLFVWYCVQFTRFYAI